MIEYLEKPPSQAAGVAAATLQRLCADGQLHARLRFLLLSGEAGKTDWGKPLLEQVGNQVLFQDASVKAFEAVVRAYHEADLAGALSRLWREDLSPKKQNDLLYWWRTVESDSLLRKAVTQLWRIRYQDTGGQDPFFTEPPSCLIKWDSGDDRRMKMDCVVRLIQDPAIPEGYRAFSASGLPEEDAQGILPLLHTMVQHDLPKAIADNLRERLRRIEENSAMKKRLASQEAE